MSLTQRRVACSRDVVCRAVVVEAMQRFADRRGAALPAPMRRALGRGNVAARKDVGVSRRPICLVLIVVRSRLSRPVPALRVLRRSPSAVPAQWVGARWRAERSLDGEGRCVSTDQPPPRVHHRVGGEIRSCIIKSGVVAAAVATTTVAAAAAAAKLVPESKSCCVLRCADGCQARAPRSRRVVVVR